MAQIAKAHTVPHTRFWVQVLPMLVCMLKYVDQEEAWLPCWLSRDLAVNLRNPWHAVEEACMQGFESKGRRQQTQRQNRVSVTSKKDQCPARISNKSFIHIKCNFVLLTQYTEVSSCAIPTNIPSCRNDKNCTNCIQHTLTYQKHIKCFVSYWSWRTQN